MLLLFAITVQQVKNLNLQQLWQQLWQTPALPFNGVNLEGVTPVSDEYKLKFERINAALNKGVCMIETGADGKPEIVRAISTFRINPDSGDADDIMLDINGALVIDYTRKVIRTALRKERRRKNTAAARRNVRSVMLAELLKLDRAEILENVEATKDQLTVIQNENNKTWAIGKILLIGCVACMW